jgi:hypothetical protein
MVSCDDSRVFVDPEGAASRLRRLPTCFTDFVFERRFVVIVAPGNQNSEFRMQNSEFDVQKPEDHSEWLPSLARPRKPWAGVRLARTVIRRVAVRRAILRGGIAGV